MISLSQFTVKLTSACTFRCLGCALWETPVENERDTIGKLISQNRFFTQFPKRKLAHLVGGDAMCYTQLASTISFFNYQGIIPVLWTHGVWNLATWDTVLPHIRYVVLFLPCPDDAQYKTLTGYPGWADFQRIVSYLRAKDVHVTLNFRVTPGLLEFLPDVQFFAQQHGCKLLIHYHPSQFDRYQVDYIRRYWWIEDIYILRSLGAPKSLCQTIPYDALRSRYQMSLNLGKEFLIYLKKLIRL